MSAHEQLYGSERIEFLVYGFVHEFYKLLDNKQTHYLIPNEINESEYFTKHGNIQKFYTVRVGIEILQKYIMQRILHMEI